MKRLLNRNWKSMRVIERLRPQTAPPCHYPSNITYQIMGSIPLTLLLSCRPQARFSNYLLSVFHFPSICPGVSLSSCGIFQREDESKGGGGTNPAGRIQPAPGNTDRLTVIGCNNAEHIKQGERGRVRARGHKPAREHVDADRGDSGECSVQ